MELTALTPFWAFRKKKSVGKQKYAYVPTGMYVCKALKTRKTTSGAAGVEESMLQAAM